MKAEQRYKVVIADDEPLILRSLRAAIPWPELGLAIVGEARNGEEALQIAREHAPHLVISDIRMPTLDGISMMKQAMESGMETEPLFIFISGYGEFEYARDALRQGAFDYLLKPIDHEELTGMIARAVEKLDRQRHSRLENERLLHSVQSLSMLARERMLAELIEGTPRPLTQLHWLESSELDQPYYMVVVQLDPKVNAYRGWSPDERQLWAFAVRNIIEEWSGRYGGLVVFPFHGGEWVLLFPDASAEAKREIGAELTQVVGVYAKLSCHVGISGTVSGLDRLSGAYEAATLALNRKFFAESRRVFLEEELPGHAAEPVQYPKALESKLAQCAQLLDVNGFSEGLEELRDYFGRSALTKAQVSGVMAGIAAALYRRFEHAPPPDGATLHELLIRLQEAQTPDEWIGQLKQAFEERMKAGLAKPSKEDGQSMIERAIRYMEARFANDLGIEEVSQIAELSTSQFCAMFKSVTGYTFLEYLTHYRMEKAKYILRHTEVKVYQIAPLVGYQDPKYFTQVFKRTTGLTPSEYREEARTDGVKAASD
ncbi:response regulator [Paenibacillus methanolicus]|uniref:Two-component system response regulator YesN n=1 Tax=Paenibacillus methanolicus TaxID=582686 RepID=A0A5S5CKW2_9BACL|nr:response regulator [Paenibacillus methanolicus]TYP79018.1 two-component system response regulator YesN [Paenibacillus methanolicus]